MSTRSAFDSVSQVYKFKVVYDGQAQHSTQLEALPKQAIIFQQKGQVLSPEKLQKKLAGQFEV